MRNNVCCTKKFIPDASWVITYNTYQYCQNCGKYFDLGGNLLVKPSKACDSRHYHHLGSLCLVCGGDERKSTHVHLSTEELAEERVKAGLSAISEFRQYQEERATLIDEILKREQLYKDSE